MNKDASLATNPTKHGAANYGIRCFLTINV